MVKRLLNRNVRSNVVVQHPRTQFVLPRPPQTDEELWWTLRAVWGMTIPRTPVCPNHSTPFSAFADAYFARSPVSVWKASRGFGGKTRMLSSLATTESTFLNAQVTILGGSGAQSVMIHEASTEAWASPHAPMNLLTTEPTKFDTKFVTGAWIRSLMASQTSVRGPHPQRLRLDEIDEMELTILEAAQGQPMMGKRGKQQGVQTQTVMSSTHQYPDKTMTEMIKRAKEKGWPVFEWCWRETSNPIDGWLTAEEIERKRTEVSSAMWDIEYDLQEPSLEGRVWDADLMKILFRQERDPVSGEMGKNYIFRQPKIGITKSTSPYVTGVDWAKEQDFTVIATFDRSTKPWQLVAWERHGRLPWPVIIKKAESKYKKYLGVFVHDSTGIGNVIKDFLDLPLTGNERDKFVLDYGMTGKPRLDLFNDYIAALENDEMTMQNITFAYDEHRYCVLDDLFGRGHPPDSVVAGAMAWAGRKVKGVRINLEGIGDYTRDESPWMNATG